MTDDRAVRLALDVAHLTVERDALFDEVERLEAELATAAAAVRHLATEASDTADEVERLRATVRQVGVELETEDSDAVQTQRVYNLIRAALEPR